MDPSNNPMGQIEGNEDGNGLINGFDLVGNGNYLATLRTSAQGGITLWQPVKLGNAVDITFEGATSNENETTLTVEDPTADRTITLPDADGTVVLQDSNGDVSVANGSIIFNEIRFYELCKSTS